MANYAARRIALMIPTIIIITLVTFSLLRIMPGDFIVAQMSEARGLDPETLEEFRVELGLDTPAPVQYMKWVGGIVVGDWGESFWLRKPVLNVIVEALPVSVQLGVMAMVIALLLAVPFGVASAVYQNSWIDYFGRSASIIGVSIPNFFMALMIIIFGARWLGWFPPFGYQNPIDNPWGNVQQFLPAAIVLGTALAGQNMRMIRTTMLETLREDYVRTARAKGLTEMNVIFRHAFRNALIPVVTLLGLQVSTVVGGSVIVETVFQMNGVGRTYIDAVTQRDYPLVQGILLMLVSVTLFANLVIDLSYSWLDPRIRYS